MNKKIVIINNGLSGGGIERASSSMANVFIQQGYEVAVVALYKREKFFKLADGIAFFEPDFGRGNRFVYSLKMMLYLRRTISVIKPDTILAFGEWTNSFVVLATRFMGIPLYLSDRMSPILSLGKFQNALKKIVYKWANGIVAQTEYAKEQLYKRTKNKNIIVIPNPVNVIERKEVEQQNCIVSVGRLTPEKGHIFLIDAFAKLSFSGWRLLIVGDGVERAKLEHRAEELGIRDNISFVGHQKNISEYLSISKIYVLPSLSEGYPNSLLEAMSLPLACISSNCVAGPGDIIRDGKNGLLVESGDSEALTAAMEKLISDEHLRLEIAHEAYDIRRTHDFERIAGQYLNFIFT